MRVAVVGGGAVGVTAAHDLAERGADVRLYERDERLGDTRASPAERVEGSSHRAAGVLAPRPTAEADAEVADRAMERFRWLAARDHRFEVVDRPNVTVVREGDDRLAAALREQVADASAVGADVAMADPEDLADRFDLVTDDLVAGAVTENAGYTVPGPGTYVAAMADRARDAGVDVRTGVDAAVTHRGDGPRVDGERFDSVVVAAGGWTKRVLAPTGVQLPLKPYRVQALVGDAAYDGPMVLDASAGTYLRPHPEGVLVGDGTVPEECDPDDWPPAGDDWFVDDATAVASERTGLAVTCETAWAGLSTATPDGEPLLGEVVADLYVACGWHGHGFMRAPATGEAVAEQVLGGDGIPAFSPGRFDGMPAFDIREGMAL